MLVLKAAELHKWIIKNHLFCFLCFQPLVIIEPIYSLCIADELSEHVLADVIFVTVPVLQHIAEQANVAGYRLWLYLWSLLAFCGQGSLYIRLMWHLKDTLAGQSYNKVSQTLLHFAVSLLCVNKLNCRPSHCSQFTFCYRFAVARSPNSQDEIALACAIDWNAHRWKSLSLSELRYRLCCLYRQASHIFVSSHY